MARTRSLPDNAPTADPVTIELTLDAELFARVREAASKMGQDVDDFIRSSVVAVTDDVVDDGPVGEPRVIRLSAREGRLLAKALDHPAEPNAAMLRAVERCRDLLSE